MNFNSLFVSSIKTRAPLYNYQTVRWARGRKPFWLGRAKTKMFIIPEPKYMPIGEEKIKYLSLKRRYNTRIKSLFEFIKVDGPRIRGLASSGNDINQVLEEEMTESLKCNESWNKECARRREERLKINTEKELEKAIKEIEFREELKMKKLEILEEIVRKEKVLSATYITPKNLDEEIEKCLDTVQCFDFAIDLDGNKYHGRKPFKPDTDKQEMPVQGVA